MTTPAETPTAAYLPSTKMVGGMAAPLIGLVVDRITEADWLGFLAAIGALVVVYFIPEMNGAWVRSALERRNAG